MLGYFRPPTLAPLLFALLLLLLQGGEKSARAEEDDYLEKCCDQGSRWAGQKLRCEKFAGDVLGVPSADQPACLEAVEICCRKAFQDAECELGKQDARAGQACRGADGDEALSSSALGVGDFRRNCCEGCKLGLLSGSRGKACKKKFSLGAAWDPAFAECCIEVKSSSTSSSTTVTSTSSTEATSENNDEFDFDDEDEESSEPVFNSTSSSDDLCKLLKGLLCTDICVPTPGSYYCKCNEGTVLQPDGRSCKSNVTTTVAPSSTSTTSLPPSSLTSPSSTSSTTTTTTKITTISSSKTTARSTKSAGKTKKPVTSTPKKKPNNPTTTTTKAKATKATTEGKKSTQPSSSLASTLKDKLLLAGVSKPRTTRSASAEDNELGQQQQQTSCPPGYRFTTANMPCEDIDECKEGGHNCGEQECYNLPGSFHCAKPTLPAVRRKPSGTAITTTTTAITRTKKTNGALTTNSSKPSAIEKCSPGFRYDPKVGRCEDVDECAEQEDACSSSNEECQNGAGSYKCLCRPGFRRDDFTGACVDVNECQLKNDCLPSQRCDNTIGSYVCVRFLPCGTGYTLNAATEICEDDDECALATHDCGSGYHCRNTLGSYRCDKDRPGKSGTYATSTTPRTTTRRTKKPSARTTARTTPRTTVTSTTAKPTTTSTKSPSTEKPSSTTVQPKITSISTSKPTIVTSKSTPTTTIPPKGGNTSTSTTTEEIPTVKTLTTVTVKPKTTSLAVRPRANCPRGFEIGSLGQCIDIDECNRNVKLCGSQRCVNTLGSFRCEPKVLCDLGYAPDRVTGQCKDIDECAMGTHKCGPKQTCENRQGGYVCYCPPGYEVGGSHQCVDIDECSRVAGLCGSGGRCVNSPGSYSCMCKPGFENDPASGGCRDVDECKAKSGNPCHQECYNTWGGHRCACRFGYRLRPDNRTCEDVDECTEFKDNHLCLGICDNTPGSYVCRCPDGYNLAEDGRTCVDIDECATGNVCKSPGDLCQNLRGSFRCNRIVCPPGYVRDTQRTNRCMKESRFCPMHDHACFQRPAHYTYNYIGIVAMYPIPPNTGQVELFTMRGAYDLPGSSVRFNLALIAARSPPRVRPATEDCFALRKPFPAQAVLVMTKSLEGPQDVELELSMEIYGPNNVLAGSAIAKIFIIVTQYEF